MSHVDPDQLALIALGTEPASPADEEHLRGCEHCRSELEDLRRTARTARAALDVGELEQPPPEVWDRILDDIEGSRRARSHRPRRPAHFRRAQRSGWVVAAGVAAVAVVGAVVWATVSASAPTVVARAELVALPDHPGAAGEASVQTVQGGAETLLVDVTGTSAPDGYHEEVWLMSSGDESPISVGRLDGTTGSFAIPDGVDLLSYPLVDVSLEPDDGDPAHSGDSLTRGKLRLE